MNKPLRKSQIVRIPQAQSLQITRAIPRPSYRRTGIILIKSVVLIGFSMAVLKAYKMMVTDCRDLGI